MSTPVNRKRPIGVRLESLEDRAVPSGFDPDPRVDFEVLGQSGDTFDAAITVHNDSDSPLENWRLEIDSEFAITDMRGAHTLDESTVTHDGTGDVIPAGGSVAFELSADGGPAVDDFDLRWGDGDADGAPATAEFKLSADWGAGFVGSVTVTNTGQEPITGWALGFDFGHALRAVWNGRLVSQEGGRVEVEDRGYNRTIRPGRSVSFGFVGAPGNVTGPPTGYTLNGQELGGEPAPPRVGVDDVTVEEGGGEATFTLSLTAPSPRTVNVLYATADGTAEAPADYTARSGQVSFAPGETTKAVTVPVVGDDIDEADEVFYLDLTAASDATVGDPRGRGFIADDDTPPPPPPPPPSGQFNYGEALQKSLFFYDVQRAGDLPDDFRVNWRGDAALYDGADVGLDLTGGYFDAGDHVKFALPGLSSWSNLTWGFLEFRDGYAAVGQEGIFLDQLRWAMDFYIRSHPEPNVFYAQVGDAGIEHRYWGAAETLIAERPSYKIDPQNPGSDVAGTAAATFAQASLAFRDSDPAYADTLLRHARDLFTFGDTYRGTYSDADWFDEGEPYQTDGSITDDLAWGAAWLYRATGESAYLQRAEEFMQSSYLGKWTASYNNQQYGAAIVLAEETGDSFYVNQVERWLDWWTVGHDAWGRVDYTDGGLAWLAEWGSAGTAATTAQLALIYSDNVNDYDGRYHDFAVGQIDYLLGDNPAAQSYVVGFGENAPKRVHHRTAAAIWDSDTGKDIDNRHVIYGALTGGPTAPDDFAWADDRTDYVGNEVALGYNKGFQGALARLVMGYGGEALADFPQPEEPAGPQFLTEARIFDQGEDYVVIQGLINNRTAWPARNSEDLSFRYYMDLSELYDAGYTADDLYVSVYYTVGGTVSDFIAHDAANDIYYVEVDYSGTLVGPDGRFNRQQTQFRIGLDGGVPPAAWDPTNDWSFQGLTESLRVSPHLPVYEFGDTLLDGEEPS